MSTAPDISEKPAGRLTVPARLDVKVGFACNNRCRFCVQGMKREKYGRRTKAELFSILEKNRRNCHGVVFTGGEPALHPDIVALVQKASDLGYVSIQLQTNGRMFAYRTLCRDVIAAGATEFSPALHGHTAALHDHLTTVPGSFEQTVAGIRNLVDLGQKIVTNSVMTRSNFRHLPDLARMLVSLGVDQFQLAFVHPVGSAGMDRNFASVVPRFALLEPFLHRALEIGAAAGIQVMTEAVPYCFMDGYEEYVGERIMPETRVVDAEGVIEDYRDYRLSEGKAKGPDCAGCRFGSECEGPWREYVQRYGWDEFAPRER
jgi:MoaA/NifB/PqqE/SkfB family radical SAM enzyme